MKATAKHSVNYNGEWHRAGETFEIDPKDANTMREFCTVEEARKVENTATVEPIRNSEMEEKPVRRSGRRTRSDSYED